jgi:hypothetical protein
MMEDINKYHVQDTWFKQPYKNLQKKHSCYEEFEKYMVYALDKQVNCTMTQGHVSLALRNLMSKLFTIVMISQ